MKKTVLITISIVLIAALVATGAVLAYFLSKDSDWEQTISSASIVFTLNDKNINTVTNEDLQLLARGESADLQLKVKLTAVGVDVSSIARFSVSFALSGTGNELARAVEVYRYENGAYRFVSMLDDFDGLAGTMAINTQRIYDYRLIYSEAAGNYYEGKTFTLNVNATSEIVPQEGAEYFISDTEGLMSAVENSAALAGKTIVLTKDLTLPAIADGGASEYVFSHKVGFDLAGHTLAIPDGVTVGMTYTSYDAAYKDLGVFSSTAGGAITKVGSGRFRIDAANDFMYIQDDLSASFSAISVEDFSFSKVVDAYAAKVAKLRQSLTQRGAEYDFTQNLKYYQSETLPSGLRLSINLGTDAQDVFDVDAAGVYSIVSTYAIPLTAAYEFTVSVGQNAASRTFDLFATVKGESATAIAGSVIAAIPDTVQGSLFLPSYDAGTRSTITWITDNKNLLSRDGEYLAGGLDSLATWTSQTVKLGCIVETFGVRTYSEKIVAISVLNAEQRTEKIYNYQQIVVEEELSTIGFYANYVDSVLAQKAGLTGIAIAVDSVTNTTAGGAQYLEIVTDANGYDDVKYANKPNLDRSAKINVTITFTYLDGGVTTSFALAKTVTAVGSQATSDPTDITQFLREQFLVNDYTDGTGYEFFVDGNTDSGMMIEYTVPSAHSAYVIVNNGVYTADNAGAYIKVGGEYLFFGVRKTLVSGEYIEDESGANLVVGNDVYSYAEQSAAGNIYRRQSKITVLPSRVPAVEMTEVPFDARLYSSVDGGGNPIYQLDGNGDVLVYNLTLVVNGIYHNNANEIVDYNLYKYLLSLYDLDGNGYIEVTEAETSWSNATIAAQLSSRTLNGTAYKYIDLSARNIESLKGLGYFSGVQGIRFVDGGLIDFSAVEELSLKYIDVTNNRIADLSQLAYRDGLQVFIANNNAISDLTPLTYLPDVRYLDVSYNANITDFSPLSEYSRLAYLDIRQSDGTNTNTQTCTYVLSLIAGNSTGVTIRRLASEATPWTATPAQVVAAKALAQLEEINNVYQTLFIPTTYTYQGTSYKLTWGTLGTDDSQYLTFTTDGDTTSGYTIVTPVVARNMSISVSVWENGATSAAMSRTCKLTLLPSDAVTDAAYIQISETEVRLAETVVADSNLLALLFSTFNTSVSGSVTVGASTYDQAHILTLAEISSVASLVINWSNKNITDLSGLRYFSGAFTGVELLLDGNALKNADGDSDISELSYLDGLDKLSLSGQQYDFNQLLTTPDGDVGLTTLTSFSAYGSYGMEEETVLAGLYRLYLQNTSCSVYKDDASTTIWNPYTEILSKYAQNIPSLFSFVNLNEEGNYYADANHSFVFNFYGVQDLTFRLIADPTTPFSGYYASTSFSNLTETVDGVNYVTGIKYISMAATTGTSYAKVLMAANDGRADITQPHYVELITEQNYNIVVIDYISNTIESGLEDIFPGRSIRASVISRLVSSVFNAASAASYDSISRGYYKNGDTYYISLLTLESLSYTDTLLVDGVYTSSDSAIQGLQYLYTDIVEISRDASVGTGEYLQNVKKLSITNSSLDLTTLTVSLPNMTDLNIGRSMDGSNDENRYCNMYTKTVDTSTSPSTVTYSYALSKFPSLRVFRCVNSNVYDWTGLNGLVGETSNSIANLLIYATSQKYTNANNNTAATAAIVKRIYDNSTAATKQYYIGSPSVATDTLYEFTGTWAEASGVSSLTGDNLKEYNEFAASISDYGIKLDGTYYVTHATKELTASSATGTLYLPKSTFDVKFGTTYNVLNADNSINADAASYSNRDFAIQYYFYGLSVADIKSLLGLDSTISLTAVYSSRANLARVPIVAITQSTIQAIIDGGDTANYTLETDANGRVQGINFNIAKPAVDKFFGIEARIGYGFYSGYDADGNYVADTYTAFSPTPTPLGDFYPITIRGTDAVADADTQLSYCEFDDLGLRTALLVCSSRILEYSTDKTYLSGCLNKAALQKISRLVWNNASKNISIYGYLNGTGAETSYIINYDAMLAEKSNNTPYATAMPYISSLYSLNGIDNLTSLKVLTATGQYITDVNDLFLLHSLTAVDLSDNLIADISGIASYTNDGTNVLTSLNLAKNVLKTVTAGSTSMLTAVLEDGLTNLNLNYNSMLNNADLAAIAAVSSTSLTEILFFNVQSRFSIAAWNSMSTIVGNSSSATVSVAINKASATSYSAAAIAALAQLTTASASNLTIYNYITNGFDNSDGLSDFIIDGVTYSISAVDPNFMAAQEFLYQTRTTMQVTSGSDSQFVIRFEAPFTFVNGTDYHVRIGSSIILNREDFDPALWSWLVRYADSTDGIYRVRNSLTSLNITTANGITSLKGVEKITTLTSVSVQYNAITELWSGAMPTGFRTFLLRDAYVTEDVMSSALALAPNLTSIDLQRTEGIDYLATVNVDGADTTLIAQIEGTNKVATFLVNNQYNTDCGLTVAGVRNVFSAAVSFISNFEGNNVGVFGRAVDSTWASVSDVNCYREAGHKVFIRVNQAALAYYIYNADSKNAYNIRKLNTTTNNGAANGTIVLDTAYTFTVAMMKQLFNAATSVGRAIMPVTLYQNDIEAAAGVIFYMPTSVFFFDMASIVSTAVTDNSNKILSGYLDTDFAFVESANYSTSTYYAANAKSFFVNADNWTDTVTKLRLHFRIQLNTGWLADSITDYTIQLSQEKVATTRQPRFYFDINNTAGSALVDSETLFESYNLIQWMFVESGFNSSYFVQTDDGWYMTYAAINAITSLSLPHKGITSLKGLEIFTNLRTLSIDRSAIVDVNALANLHLTSFTYTNSVSWSDNYYVNDFYPLLLGSKNTLTTFAYQAYTNVEMADLSILMAFGSQLTTIRLYDIIDARNQYTYLETPSFLYMLSWFATNRPSTQILINKSLVTSCPYIIVGNYKRLLPISYYSQAAEILSVVDFGAAATLTGNMLIAPAETVWDGDSQTITLPAFINKGGAYYAIDWRPSSSAIGVNDIVYHGASTSYTLADGTSIALTSGATLTYAQLEQLSLSSAFVSDLSNDKVSVDVTISLIDGEKLRPGIARVSACIKVNGYFYERMFNILPDYADVLTRQFNATYVVNNTNGLFTAEQWSEISAIFAAAIIDIDAAEGRLDDAYELYRGALYDMAAVVGDFITITYYDADDNVLGAVERVDANTEITLRGAISGCLGWLIDGYPHAFGSTYQTANRNVLIFANVQVVEYYIVESSATDLTSPYLHKLAKIDNSTYVARNFQVSKSGTSFSTRLKSPYRTVGTTFKIVDNGGSMISLATYIPAAQGNYDLTFSLLTHTVTAVENEYFYSVMGTFADMSKKWNKPEPRYPLAWDEDAQLYYISELATKTYTTEFKICATSKAVTAGTLTYVGYPNSGWNSFPLTGNTCDISGVSIGISIANASYATIYLDPSAPVYKKVSTDLTTAMGITATAGLGAPSISAAQVAAGISSLYSSSGMLIMRGNYADTKDIARLASGR